MEIIGWLPLVGWGVVALAILIFVHEGGHFLVAKAFRLKVYEFMFGLPGPKLVKRRVGETLYGVTAIPFGGHVKFAGSDPFEELAPEDVPRSFPAQPLWKKALIIGAGPVANLGFALLAFWLFYLMTGIPTATTTVARVLPGSPAEAVGLTSGDRIVRAAERPTDDWGILVGVIRRQPGRPLRLLVERKGRTVMVTPTLAATETPEGQRVGFLGIEPTVRQLDLGWWVAARAAWQTELGVLRLVVSVFAPREFVRSLPDFRGPIGITEMAVQAAERGAGDYTWFVAIISLSLGVFNLLPIPPLDGGRVVIAAVEAARRKPLDERTLVGLTAVGASLLVTLMVYLVYSDLARLLT